MNTELFNLLTKGMSDLPVLLEKKIKITDDLELPVWMLGAAAILVVVAMSATGRGPDSSDWVNNDHVGA